MGSKVRHWLFSSWQDLLILLAPVWICWGVIFFLSKEQLQMDIPLWVWVCFIMVLDVGHVWSTLFRTYASKTEYARYKKQLIIFPILIVVVSFSVAFYSQQWFWRCLAYFAVYHFIKQQYGFVALYKRNEGKREQLLSDKFIIYFATLYPVLYWHLAKGLNFNWFVSGDFFDLSAVMLSPDHVVFTIANSFYWLVILGWLIQEFLAWKEAGNVAFGKILWVLTTAINWYFAIVYYNSDLVFSVTNVVAHGVPYIFIIYKYKVREKASPKSLKALKWAGLILATIAIVAFVEEYFWDMLVYGDREHFFGAIYPYEYDLLEGNFAIALAIAILSLPQILHYIMDGYIWKMNENNPSLKNMFN